MREKEQQQREPEDERHHVWRIDGTRSIVVNDAGEILLTREYRHELKDYDWRLPCGKLDRVDENIVDAASRELGEETGVTARKWEYLWVTAPDATVRFQRHFLLATNISVGPQRLEEGEKISLSWFSQPDVVKMALEGQLREEISALSLLSVLQAIVGAQHVSTANASFKCKGWRPNVVVFRTDKFSVDNLVGFYQRITVFVPTSASLVWGRLHDSPRPRSYAIMQA